MALSPCPPLWGHAAAKGKTLAGLDVSLDSFSWSHSCSSHHLRLCFVACTEMGSHKVGAVVLATEQGSGQGRKSLIFSAFRSTLHLESASCVCVMIHWTPHGDFIRVCLSVYASPATASLLAYGAADKKDAQHLHIPAGQDKHTALI